MLKFLQAGGVGSGKQPADGIQKPLLPSKRLAFLPGKNISEPDIFYGGVCKLASRPVRHQHYHKLYDANASILLAQVIRS